MALFYTTFLPGSIFTHFEQTRQKNRETVSIQSVNFQALSGSYQLNLQPGAKPIIIFSRAIFKKSRKQINRTKIAPKSLTGKLRIGFASMCCYQSRSRLGKIKTTYINLTIKQPSWAPNMQDQIAKNNSGIKASVYNLLSYRKIMWQLILREIRSRFQGSFLGIMWLVLQPLFLLFTYTLVFGIVFKARWNGAEIDPLRYGLAIFIGMILHSVLSDCLLRSPTLITAKANFVKKVVFPLEILPPVQVVTAFIQGFVGFALFLLAVAVFGNGLNFMVLLTPIFILPLFLHSLGITWFLAALGVYVRDVGQVTTMLTTALLFLSPVFYPLSALPEPFATIVFFNPLTYSIESMRDIVFNGTLPGFTSTVIQFLFSLVVAFLGLTWFKVTQRGFADVL